MIVLTSIYQVLIGPLELFFEVVFSIADRVLGDPALAIIFLSLAMNFLVLPLYRQADAMQEAERDRAARMKPVVDHFKRTFKGDERFMMLQTYYRQIGYKQTDALKGSVSLLLEIPFFIAAYHFLSNLEILRGVPLGPIRDLGAPDGLIQLGDITINLLPILMTVINLVSAATYLKGFPLKSKIQTYGIAVIFLVLLYGSPAGLVFYWTLNNVFSLVKNLFYKLKNPGRVLAYVASVVGIVLLVAAIFAMSSQSMKFRAGMVVCALLLQIPIAISMLRRRSVRMPHFPEADKRDDRAFLIGSIFLALLTGVLIPISVIQASPGEFVDLSNFQSPLWYVFDSFLLAFGTFVVWLGIFYRLASPQGRYVFGALLFAACGVFLVDYLLFGTGYGNLSPTLLFDEEPVITGTDMLVNLGAILVVALVLFFLWRKKRSVAQVAYACMCIATAAVSVMGAVQISSDLKVASDAAANAAGKNAHFTLSAEGENVIVIMLDRAISAYVPFIMEEHPEIAKQFDGFTWYSNAMSYGSSTNSGSPSLYGGYEYTPENIDARADVSLGDKQDEALKVMPVLFSGKGYNATVLDPTYAGYGWTPDLSIFDDYPGIEAYITTSGGYATDEFGVVEPSNLAKSLRSRNFFCYSIFKVAPLFAQPTLYDGGAYNSAKVLSMGTGEEAAQDLFQDLQVRYGWSKAEGVDQGFLRDYSVLQNLPEMTVVSDEASGAFMMMANDTTHDPTMLQEPECRPAQSVDNTEYDREHDVRYDAEGNVLDITNDNEDYGMNKHLHYEINTAALRELGDWFDYLREQGVYDNTRIILVSDHGWSLHLYDDEIFEYKSAGTGETTHLDVLRFNCLLMEKDFGATGFTRDDGFMTNADVPLMALEGIVSDPVNPSTGNALTDDEKYAAEHHVQWTDEWSTYVNNGNVFMPADWFSLTGDDVADVSAWSYLGYY